MKHKKSRNPTQFIWWRARLNSKFEASRSKENEISCPVLKYRGDYFYSVFSGLFLFIGKIQNNIRYKYLDNTH